MTNRQTRYSLSVTTTYQTMPKKIISNHATDTHTSALTSNIQYILHHYNDNIMYHITTKEIAQTQQKVHPTKAP